MDGEHLECDAVVIAMGPWASMASEWFATHFPIEGHKYHSIVLRPQQPMSADMLFLNYRGPHGEQGLQLLQVLRCPPLAGNGKVISSQLQHSCDAAPTARKQCEACHQT